MAIITQKAPEIRCVHANVHLRQEAVGCWSCGELKMEWTSPIWSRILSVRFRYPLSGALMHNYAQGDFIDSQIAQVPDPSLGPVDLALMTFFAMPRWILGLMRLRNILMRPFGLKTGEETGFVPPKRDDLLSGRYKGIFGVRSVTRDEVVFGENDRHLDFRVSILKTIEPEGHVAISTWVRPHNLWGRLYLWAVYPFHKLIVWRMLANLRDLPRPDQRKG